MRYLLKNQTFNLEQKTLTENTILDHFINFPFKNVFEEFINHWQNDPSKFQYIEKFLKKRNKPNYFGSVIWKAAQKNKLLLEFICNLEFEIVDSAENIKNNNLQEVKEKKRNAQFFKEHSQIINQENQNSRNKEENLEGSILKSQKLEIKPLKSIKYDIFSEIIADFKAFEIQEMMSDSWLMQKKGDLIVIEAIKKQKLNDLKQIFQNEIENQNNKDQNNIKPEINNFKKSFSKMHKKILDMICQKQIKQAKARILITQIDIDQILNYKSKNGFSILMCLAKTKNEAILILIFKIVEKHASHLKPKIKEMLEEEDQNHNKVRDYLLSTQNKMYFEYFNSYFETKIFSDFKFLDATLLETRNKKFNFKKNIEKVQDKNLFYTFFKTFNKSNFEQLKNVYKIFKENKTIEDIEKKELINFKSEFVNSNESFLEMMKDLKKQSILGMDMEYYKATNNSQTSCNFIFITMFLIVFKDLYNREILKKIHKLITSKITQDIFYNPNLHILQKLYNRLANSI